MTLKQQKLSSKKLAQKLKSNKFNFNCIEDGFFRPLFLLKCKMQSAKCKVQNAKCKMQNAICYLLFADRWWLEAASWRLVDEIRSGEWGVKGKLRFRIF